ncbi:MAG: triose-phosphate isomerase [Rhodospirillales bacterium]|jgi:triosephosphate isomerase|nr:triose-phosphate isomerase [Rhodospirillaceae bacterium]MDP6430644.1 triose-phosphate isomerase [Rhodospirillales bacterium]MDP6645659.1 triose-phosphate isomerase [Rhodospirillales bacterium]MDP6843787.1 triose-phosphate isomerase [Rhodospirillales bacterium]
MSQQRTPLIAGNWKMNGRLEDGAERAEDLAGRMQAKGGGGFQMLLCPPATLLTAVGAAIADSGIFLGAQDCHFNDSGAHTGDISAAMLADLGCSHVIVGHSERRADHGENDALVNAKAAAAIAAGLIAIVCVGETEAQRDAGETNQVVAGQARGSVPDGANAGNLVIAYEPVWAIGTGRTPTAAEVQAVHAMIRATMAGITNDQTAAGCRILYGGSVKPGNAAELLSLADVDGGLVGGASLSADDFWAIATAAG